MNRPLEGLDGSADPVAGVELEPPGRLAALLADAASPAPRASRLALLVAAWAAIGLLWVLPPAISALWAHEPVPWDRLLPVFFGWQVWLLLAPFVLATSRRFPLDRGPRLPKIAVHLGAALVCSVVDLLVYTALRAAALSASGREEPFGGLVRLHFLQGGAAFDLLLYAAIAAAGHAADAYRRSRLRELHATRLETRLVEAQLQVLKMQLHPHFLFNTLHSISALMHRDVEAADRMIAVLSDLLRQSLRSTEQHVVPLQQELDFLGRYLEIETTRFSDRLRVVYDVDPSTLGAMVPNLILQPLVENSIRHGIALRSAPGCIEIRSRREGERLHLEVQDDGPGVPGSAPSREGIGLSNTRVRLAQLYGAAHELAVRNAARGGLLVSIAIPLTFTPPLTPQVAAELVP